MCSGGHRLHSKIILMRPPCGKSTGSGWQTSTSGCLVLRPCMTSVWDWSLYGCVLGHAAQCVLCVVLLLYRHYAPEKVGEVDKLLAKAAGKEERLFAMLIEKVRHSASSCHTCTANQPRHLLTYVRYRLNSSDGRTGMLRTFPALLVRAGARRTAGGRWRSGGRAGRRRARGRRVCIGAQG